MIFNIKDTSGKGEYLPLTGGYASGAIGSVKSDNTEVTVKAKNPLGNIDLIVSADGRRGLFDRTDSRWVIEAETGKEPKFHGTASGNLPLDGGGTVKRGDVNPLVINSTSTEADEIIRIPFQKSGVTKGYLGFVGTKPMFTMANYNRYELHHDGNSARVHISQTAPSDTNALWVY